MKLLCRVAILNLLMKMKMRNIAKYFLESVLAIVIVSVSLTSCQIQAPDINANPKLAGKVEDDWCKLSLSSRDAIHELNKTAAAAAVIAEGSPELVGVISILPRVIVCPGDPGYKQ